MKINKLNYCNFDNAGWRLNFEYIFMWVGIDAFNYLLT